MSNSRKLVPAFLLAISCMSLSTFAAAQVTLSKTSLSFGSEAVGSATASQSVTMTNTGTAALTIGSIAVTGTNATSFVFANSCGSSLAAGANCTIHGHFQPTANGPLTAAITITDNGGGSPQSIALSGTGLGPAVTLSATSLSYGSSAVGTATASQTVTLTNSGQGTLSITSISVTGANPTSFPFTNTCGTSVAAGANCSITGDFDPTTGGSLKATITLTDNVGGSPQSIALTGTGLGPAATLSVASVAFGSEPVGGSTASQYITLTNSGNAPLNINSIALTGANASSFTFANSCAVTLAAGANCSIHGHFNPVANGPLAAAIIITDNAGGSPQSIALSGTGLGPAVTLSAPSLSFGSSAVGTATASQMVTLTNSGQGTLSIASIAVTGANASSFLFTNTCGTSVAAGANCSITGDFDPTTGGSLKATVTITDNASGSPQSIGLTGTGLGSAASLSATSLLFGSEAVGSATASQYVTLTNPGTATLSITSITVTGTNASSFAFANTCGTSLAAGANCSIHGHFAPTTGGALTAAVTIVDNAGGSPQSIALSGTGLGPAVTLSATSLSFGSSAVGTATASQSVTLTNSGQGALSITSIGVTGVNASSFASTSTCGTSVAVGANCSISVDFDPTMAGPLAATVAITDNAGGSPQGIALSGTGLGPVASLSAQSLSFGSEAEGSATASQTVTLTNTGGQALSITSITVTGPNASSFTFGNSCGTSLAVGANCSIHGHFAPTVGGPLTAAITIVDNAANSPQSIALSGTGIPPALTLPAGGALAAAIQNDAYSGAITASGGSGSGYVFTVNTISIPTTGTAVPISNDISVSSTGTSTLTITGTPTSAGTVTLTNVTVKDSLGDTAGPDSYTIAVQGSYAVSGQINLNNYCGGTLVLPTFNVSINTTPVQTTSTNGSGNYTFAGVPNGTYTITPSISGPSSAFYPATQTGVVVNGAPAVVGNISAALGYTVSGTVSYSGTSTGRIYVSLANNSCNTSVGTSIVAPGAFTIRGAAPGSYTVSSWMDNRGHGAQNASNPTSVASNFVISDANLSGVGVTLDDPATVTLKTAPTLNAVNGFDGGAFVQFKDFEGNGVDLPLSYTVEWSTSQSFSSVAGSATFAAVGDQSPWIVTGIANGSGYYFRAQGVAGSSISPWSAVVGPVTIGTPTGANAVSGNVIFSQTATGPLYVGVFDQNTQEAYITVVGSKTSPPTSPASYTVQAPTGSNYFLFAILDQDNNGLIDDGDITNVNGYDMITPTLVVSGNTAKNLTLASGNSVAVVRSENDIGFSEWSPPTQGYQLDFDVTGVAKRPVAVTVISGPGMALPLDAAWCNGCGYDVNSQFSFNTAISSTVPTVGAAYGIQVTYSDGTQETISPKITALVSPPVNISPQGPVSSTNTTPTLTWVYPANASQYLYQMWFADENYSTVWSIPNIYSNTNGFTSSIAPSISWGVDPTGATGNAPSLAALTDGNVYHWEVVAYDANGNRGQTFVDYVPGFVPLSLPTANPVTLGPAYLGQSYSGTIGAGGGYGGYSYAINGIYNCYGCAGFSIGNGLYVINANGTLNISGVPTQLGTVSFEVYVRDASSDNPVGPVTYTITITHEAVSLPAASSNPLGTPLVGVPYARAIHASGGAGGANYSFTVNGVSIPTNSTYVPVTGADGLTFANSGGSTLAVGGTPASVGTLSVEVTVTDTTDSSNTASMTYSAIVSGGPNGANNGLLKGTYVCKFDGFNDSDGSRWASLSSFYADGTDTSGNGNLTGGEWNMSTHSINAATTAISGTLTGTYSIGADNNGLMTLNSVQTSPGTGTHSGAYAIALNDVNLATTTATEFRLVETDDVGATPSGTHGSGLCYQANTSAFAATTLSGNSFVDGMQGEDESGLPEAMVSRMTLSTESATGGTGGVPGGAITSYVDDDFYIKKTTNRGGSCASTCGTYTAPDAHGRFTTSIPVVVQGVQATSSDVVYIVDANRAFILMASGDGGVQSGDVRKQQQTTYSATNLDGSFVVYSQGFEYSGGSVWGYDSSVVQGTGTGAGGMTIEQNYQDADGTFKNGGSVIGTTLPVTFDSSNPGRATASPGGDSFFLYFFDTNSALQLDWNGGGNPSYLATGWMEPQTQTTYTNAALAGNYLLGQLHVMQAVQDDATGELDVLSNGTVTGGVTEADAGYFIWDQVPSWTYSWYTTGAGGFSVAGTGDTGGDSCIVISATKTVCTTNADSWPSVGILQQ